MHNEIAEYLSKYVSRIDELYRWPFKEEIPRRDFGFSFSGKTAFQKTLELKRQISDAAKDAPPEEEKERLATYFIKDWGGIAKISDARKPYRGLIQWHFPKPSVELISVLKR